MTSSRNVNYFVASDAKNCSTQNLFRFCIDADFQDETLCLTFFVSPAHLTHRIFRSQGTASGFSYLCVRHAASPEWRINKITRSAWMRSAKKTRRLSRVEEIVRNNLVVVIGGMRKRRARLRLQSPQRPDAGHVRLQLIIKQLCGTPRWSVATPSPVQSQVVCVGSTSHGQKNLSTYYFWQDLFFAE